MSILQPSPELRYNVLHEAAELTCKYANQRVPMLDRKELQTMVSEEHAQVANRAISLYRRMLSNQLDGRWLWHNEQEELELRIGYMLDANRDDALTHDGQHTKHTPLQVELYTGVEAKLTPYNLVNKYQVLGQEAVASFQAYTPDSAVINGYNDTAFIGPMKMVGVSPGGVTGNLPLVLRESQLADLDETLNLVTKLALVASAQAA